MSSENTRLSRRRLLGTGSVLGAASLLSTSVVQSVEKTPEKFAGLRPLRPAAKFSAAEAVDHGWGTNCLAIGGGVNGGQFYGNWPGLHEDFLFQGADVRATTDFRSIFGEMLMRRLHNNKLGDVFPGFTAAEYKPLGIFAGAALQGDFNDPDVIFRDGVE